MAWACLLVALAARGRCVLVGCRRPLRRSVLQPCVLIWKAFTRPKDQHL